MLRPGTFALTALLAALSATGPLTTDMYLPSLPDIARQLNGSTAQVQFTISAYLIGFAVGQIFYGPVSDRHGRKPVLMAAIALYCVASLTCALSTSIEMLIVARAFQALGGVESGQHDALIAGAAAQVTRNCYPHFLFGGIGVIAQKLQ